MRGFVYIPELRPSSPDTAGRLSPKRYSPIFSMFLLRQNDTTLLSLMSGHWLSQCPDIRGQGTDFSCPLTTEAVDYSAAAMLTVMVPILPPSALSARVPPGVTVMVALGAEATSVPTAVAIVAVVFTKGHADRFIAAVRLEGSGGRNRSVGVVGHNDVLAFSPGPLRASAILVGLRVPGTFTAPV